MSTHASYYQDSLYPLQDRCLAAIAGLGSPFYLTGGTALTREYLRHRYSDDLDLFCNDAPSFENEAERIIRSLGSAFPDLAVGTTVSTFVRLFLRDGDVELKLDLVNDVPYHAGEILPGRIFPLVDNPLNILSNKLAALARGEAKDVADILWISRAYPFDWARIMEEAKRKDVWGDELDASRVLAGFPIANFENIRWIEAPDLAACERDLQRIAEDLAFGRKNGLVAGQVDRSGGRDSQ